MGFHGDDRQNPKLEMELFHTNEVQTAGINFDKVRTRFLCIPNESYLSSGTPSFFNQYKHD